MTTRFSDDELRLLRSDFDRHIADEDLNDKKWLEKWEDLARMIEKNAEATNRIALAVADQAESTADIVQLWSDMQGAARVGSRVQKALLWLSGMGAAGLLIAGFISYVINKH